jgi:ELWxxDGT repeat protein
MKTIKILLLISPMLLINIACFSDEKKTNDSVQLIKDINPGKSGSTPRNLTVFKNKLYFSAYDDTNYSCLWAYDGVKAPYIASHRQACNMIVYNDKLYFSSYDNSLWVYDGQAEPVFIYNFPQGDIEYGSDIKSMTICNGKLYFTARKSYSNHNSPLWVYDGVNPPAIVYDIAEDYFHLSKFVEFQNKLIFNYNASSGDNIISFDGAIATPLISEYSYESPHNPESFFVYKDKLYFRAWDDYHGSELWVYDGINKPVMLSDLVLGDDGAYPDAFSEMNGNMYFSGSTSYYDYILWVYDGENLPRPVESDSPHQWIGVTHGFNNKLYLTSYDNNCGTELWMYDGLGKPVLFCDINKGSESSSPENYFNFNGKLYFTADDGAHGEELFVVK